MSKRTYLSYDTVTPFKKDGNSYVCKNERGGHVWVKPAEFLAEVNA